MLLMQAVTAVKVVTGSKPSMESSSTDTANSMTYTLR